MVKSKVFYFNPTCELAVANGSFSYMPPALLRQFEADCAILPFLMANQHDFVISPEQPAIKFINQLNSMGFDLPTFCKIEELKDLTSEPFDWLEPWGWSPAAHFYLKNIKPNTSVQFQNNPEYYWESHHRLIYERETSLQFLKELIRLYPDNAYIKPELIGRRVESVEEIESLLKSHFPLVVKSPISSSGRGNQIIRKPILSNSNQQWIKGVFDQQNYLIVEPLLEKEMDLSFHFNIKNQSNIEYLGFSVFETNANGQYKNSVIHPELGTSEKASLLAEKSTIIDSTAIRLKKTLSGSIYAEWHRGFLGVDALFFKNKNELKLQPCIEINSRMTMGILTKAIEKRIHPESRGNFALFNGATGDFAKYCNEETELNPIKMKNGFIGSGFLALTEPDEKKKFGAYLKVQNSYQ